jgi:hypothetical protein
MPVILSAVASRLYDCCTDGSTSPENYGYGSKLKQEKGLSHILVNKVMTLNNAVFWDVAPCGFIINRRFGGTCHLHLQGRRNNAIYNNVSL